MYLKSNEIIFFDTTARDGKQAPGNDFGPDDTVELARRLAKARVSVFEAGFPIAGPADQEAVRRVAEEVEGIQCCALARAVDGDIDCAADAFQNAIVPPRIHVFIASSEKHMETKLQMKPDEVIDAAVRAVQRAKQYVDDVEFSPEDASRTGFDFLKQIIKAVILAGARTINIPDTTGYAVPEEFGRMISRLIAEVSEIAEHNVVISVHCHNDLGMATANSLAGLKAGARQVHATVNGIGERPGNTHYAEVAMALKTRRDYYGLNVSLDTTQIGSVAHFLSSVIRKPIPDTLPVVGESVFAHSSGIHQHGVDRDRSTYEIMSPEAVGWVGEAFPLSSKSGRNGLRVRLAELGYELSPDDVTAVYQQFVPLAESKTLVHNNDLHMLMQEFRAKQHAEQAGWISLQGVEYHKIDDRRSGWIQLARDGKEYEVTSHVGNGPVNVCAHAIETALKCEGLWPDDAELATYAMKNTTPGTDSMAAVQVVLTRGAVCSFGRGGDTDIVVASVQAIVAALNHLMFAPVSM